MLKEALEYLTELSAGNGPAVIDVHEEKDQVHKLVVRGVGQPAELVTYPITRPRDKKYFFEDLDAFTDFVNTQLPPPVVVMCGDEFLDAIGAFNQGREWYARLELRQTDEFKALQKAYQGVTQEEMWRLLITDLDGCVGPELLLAVSQLQVRQMAETNVQIDLVGLQDVASRRALEVTCTDAKGKLVTAAVPQEVVWKGPVYTCLADAFTLKLRVVVQAREGKIQFSLHPRRPGEFRREVLHVIHDRVADALKDNEQIEVYEGWFYWP